MPAMQYDHDRKLWAKQCTICKRTYEAKGQKWDAAAEVMKEHFWFRETIQTTDNMNSQCKSCDSLRKTKRIDNGLFRDEMLIKQNFKCAICERQVSFGKGNAGVDHCHVTGLTRGILCVVCNVRLGILEDIEWVEKAKAYQERFK